MSNRLDPLRTDDLQCSSRAAAAASFALGCKPRVFPHRQFLSVAETSYGHTYALNVGHCVFGTKGRLPLTTGPAESWGVLRRVAASAEIHVRAIGGTSKHVHLLLDLPSTCTSADVPRELRANSSARFRRLTARFAWQEEYDAISVSPSAVQSVISYVSHQPEHHSRQSFEDEYLATWNGRA